MQSKCEKRKGGNVAVAGGRRKKQMLQKGKKKKKREHLQREGWGGKTQERELREHLSS